MHDTLNLIFLQTLTTFTPLKWHNKHLQKTSLKFNSTIVDYHLTFQNIVI